MLQDFFINIVESNIGFEIGNYLLIYIGALWILFCAWVYVDASKRYKDWRIGIFMFLVALIFNFLGLLFYLIIRPEKEEDHILIMGNSGMHSDNPLVNVPVVNFIGENGLTISLNLSIKNPNSSANKADLPAVKFNLDVDDTQNFELKSRSSDTLNVHAAQPKEPITKKLKQVYLKLKDKVLTNIKKDSAQLDDDFKAEDHLAQTPSSDLSVESTSEDDKKEPQKTPKSEKISEDK